MNKYIVVSFAFMALGFYELSGGDDFVPRKAELIAAAQADKDTKQAAPAVRLADTAPEAAVITASVSELDLRTQTQVAAAPQPNTSAPVTPPVVAADAPVATTLISLEQSGEMFARPLSQLGATLREAQPARVITQEPPADLREVAGSRVNIRSGPGTGFDVLTSLPQGTAVEVIDSDGAGWVKLRTVEEELVGWMAEYLLTDPTG